MNTKYSVLFYIQQQRQLIMKISIKTFTPAILAVLISAPFSQASAVVDTKLSTLAVKTSIVEVNGVRDIEAGNYQRGIRKSEAALAKATIASLRKPLLDNLCVANIALKNMEQAKSYCNEAVNTGQASAISYNNRAVLHYMNGDYQASAEDLEVANELGAFSNLVKDNMYLVSKQNMLTQN